MCGLKQTAQLEPAKSLSGPRGRTDGYKCKAIHGEPFDDEICEEGESTPRPFKAELEVALRDDLTQHIKALQAVGPLPVPPQLQIEL